MYSKLIPLFVLLSVQTISFSQEKETKALQHSAELNLKNGNYDDALEDYLQLIKIDQKNADYNYKLGVCYLNTNINKAKAVPYLENVVRVENHVINADFLLGRAYQYANCLYLLKALIASSKRLAY